MGSRPRIRSRRGRRLSHPLVPLLIAALLLVAAGAAETPKMGGGLKIAFEGEPVTLDPEIRQDLSGWTVEDFIFNALCRYAPKPGAEGTVLIPDLAAGMPAISADGTAYTIKLRPDAKFAPPVDRAVTADDVKYRFERMMAEPHCPATYFYPGVEGAQALVDKKAKEITGVMVIDPLTIQFKLTSPDLSFPYALSMEFCVRLVRGRSP